MIQATVRRRRVSVATRILTALQASGGGPLHYRRLAQRLHHPKPQYVLSVCLRLAHAGKLEWCGLGTYRIRQEHAHGA
jgi:hypothetical protein